MINPLMVNKWVKPFYLKILHANYTSARIVDTREQEQFIKTVNQRLAELTPAIANKLIAGHWREAIVGSWFAGLKPLPDCQDAIGQRLLASETCYAGQAHAFAMACYANEKSVAYLQKYLDTYLRKPDCYYDQGWAMPALLWVDVQLGTQHAAPFLEEGGLWNRFIENKCTEEDQAWTIKVCKKNFWEAMTYCNTHFRASFN
jgi:hypothetical protein